MHFNFFKFLFDGEDSVTSGTADMPQTGINPSTGLPMIDSGMSGVDVGGSPFGMDVHSHANDSFTDAMGSNPWD